MATLNSSILLIALPDVFRGIHLDPLQPGNSSYLLWLIVGYPIVIAVLTVSLGRFGDMFGRVRMFTLGFVIFTVFSVLLASTGCRAATARSWLILLRLGQGLGGALIFANSSAILTDAFPQEPARPGARDQQRRRARRLVHRPPARRPARAAAVAARLPRLRPDRPPRDGLGTPQPPRARRRTTRRGSTGGATRPSPPGSSR